MLLLKREKCFIKAQKTHTFKGQVVKNRNGDKTHTRAASNEVRFRINSFKVPELYFEISKTVTIGSLKRKVMNVVKVKLGGELHVGILLEGKKVIDNNRTLQHTGISHNCDLGTLGFILEPSLLEASPSVIQQEPPLREKCFIKAQKTHTFKGQVVKNRNGDKTHTRAASNEVRFRINSFKVPELYFEISKTVTIGSLKRKVMNVVKVKLGGELHVGILLEGKKVIDNNRTLQHTGISHNCDLGTLGFILEPSLLEASPSVIQQEPPLR
ncbi:Homeodomain-like protein [Artemisia annua]|uniref:Homeodomain-like protein n=1 Tax=Artemisia annua TaxID=35608 RepID=A0A2U1LBF6_ARTAN|nr:Homeodomain-like protein [Artemisia annua]